MTQPTTAMPRPRVDAVRDARQVINAHERIFDRLTALAAKALRAELAGLTMLDDENVYVNGGAGRFGRRDESFCQLVVASGETVLIEDASQDVRAASIPLVASGRVRSYAGVPVRSEEGHVLGAFCVMDRAPRVWTDDEVDVLHELAGMAVSELESHSSRMLLERVPFGEVPAPMYVCDLESRRILAVNDAALAQYGFTRAEFLTLRADDLRPPEEVPELIRAFGGLTGTGFRKHGMWRHWRKDGTLLDVDVRSREVLFADRACVAVLAMDMTEQLRAERRLQHVTAHSPAVLFAMTLENRVMTGVWVSSNVTDMLGYTVEDTANLTWWVDNLHPDDRDGVMQEVGRLYDAGVLSFEHRFRCADGSYRWVRAQMRVLRNDAGEPIELVGSWIDATDFRMLEDQLRQSQKMEAVGRVAGGIAHDFNNILTAITGHSELALAQLPAQDPVRDDIQQVRSAADRAAALTRQLLAFSRKQVLRAEPLDLGVVVCDIERMLRRVVSENIELLVDAPTNLGLVAADRSQIEQVLLNLVVNAGDAIADGGTIRIGLQRRRYRQDVVRDRCRVPAGTYLMLTVADSGSGMSEAVLERIFEPFFTTKPVGKGTGLGLSTVYGIVRQSSGHIWARSTPGAGSTFEIQLPCTRSATFTAVGQAPAAHSAATGDETILLVEDESTVRDLARRILTKLGYTVLTAAHGNEALELARDPRVQIDLLLTDLVMPHMSGCELASALTALYPRIRVVYMSGYSEEAVSGNVFVAADVAFLEKPFTAGGLGDLVRQTLDRP